MLSSALVQQLGLGVVEVLADAVELVLAHNSVRRAKDQV